MFATKVPIVRRAAAVKVAIAVLGFLAPASSVSAEEQVAGDVVFRRAGSRIDLANSVVQRSWRVEGGRLRGMALVDYTGPHSWTFLSKEFWIVLDGIRLDSDDFVLDGVVATEDRGGLAVGFTFRGPVPGLTLERRVALFPRTPVFEITSSLRNDLPAAHAVSAYSLDEIDLSAATAEVHAYHGGSDWREDFRNVSLREPPFDDEGQVARFDDGEDRGWFFVAERRGGAASRVGSDGSRTWAGADFARDLASLGPLQTQPPSYNRLENPVYPVPARARRIAPSSEFRLGRVATGLWHGGPQQAAAGYVRYMSRFRRPVVPPRVLLNSWRPWGRSAAFNDATMRAQADVAAQLGIDTIVLDDQWQGGQGGESGDWRFDPVRFPDADGDGLPDVIAYFRSKGVDLGLWMTPANFNRASRAFAQHPLWACTPIGTAAAFYPDEAGFGVWDITNQEVRAYLTGVVDRMVGEWSVRYFKLDFMTWVECPPHDYNDYEDAFVSWIDELQARHGGVTFSFDETNDQRMYAFESVARGPLWFDNGASAPSDALHDVWAAAPWVPPSALGMGTYDGGVLGNGYSPGYLMPIALLTHLTFWTDLARLTASEIDETAWWLRWYREHAAALGGLVYNLAKADPADGISPAVFQPWDPDGGGGFLFAFRQDGPAPTAALEGLQPGRSYTLTNVRDGSVLGTFSAPELTSGIALPLSQPRSAAVYEVTAPHGAQQTL